MTSAIVFSKNRPAQLDLLLRSLVLNAPWVDDITVIYRSTSPLFTHGYHLCEQDHKAAARFYEEKDHFRTQVVAALRVSRHPYAMFLCDDDVIYRNTLFASAFRPEPLLGANHDLLCVSLRLGANTTRCYSLRRAQAIPANLDAFTWRDQEGDFGYPGSLDGNVFRTDQLLTLIAAGDPRWTNPNELEDHLHRATQTALLPLMACYPQSCLVGVPVNMVNTSHDTNRHAETHRAPIETLNKHYLTGRRLDLAAIRPELVDAAHTEFKLEWEPKEVAA